MNVLAVAIGGCLGSIVRYTMGLLMPTDDQFPIMTLIINLLGCFVLAYFFTLIMKRGTFNPQIQLAVGTGLIGSFTTFSTFSVETLQLVQDHHYYWAGSYVLLSVVGGIGFAFLGVFVARFKSIKIL